MTYLNITQNINNTEVVNAELVQKLYDVAVSISEPQSGQTDNAYISGHLEVDKAYEELVKYLAGRVGLRGARENNASGRFQDLTIDVTNDYYVPFGDSEFERIVTTEYNSGQPMTYTEVAAVTDRDIMTLFSENSSIIDATAFKYFTGFIGPNSSLTQYGGVFYNCANLERAEMPNQIQYCDNQYWNSRWGWFSNCPKLSYVKLSNSLTHIGKYMFYGDTSLQSIDLSNTQVTNIGGRGFSGSGIKYITWPISTVISEIGNSAFSGCTLLESIDLSNTTITELSLEAFNGCTNLQSIYLPQTCKTLYQLAFSNCPNLRLSASDLLYVETIIGNRNAWLFCGWFSTGSSLPNTKNVITSTDLYLPNMKDLGFGAFAGQSQIQTINLPALTTLHVGAVFARCESLTTVTSLGNITSLNYNDIAYGVRMGIFEGCSNLTTVNLPSGLTEISPYMFSVCQNLANVNIPTTITYVGQSAFDKCNALTNKVFYLPNLVNISARQPFATTADFHMYLPKLNDFKDKENNGNLSDSRPGWEYGMSSWFVFEKSNSSYTMASGVARTNTIYFKDVTYFPAGLFVGAAIKTVIINNTTVPTLEATANSNILNRYPDVNTYIFAHYWTQASGYDLDIYVPDSALTAYQASPLFANVVNNLKALSTCPRITLAQAEAGSTGVIEDYM